MIYTGFLSFYLTLSKTARTLSLSASTDRLFNEMDDYYLLDLFYPVRLINIDDDQPI